MNTNDRAFAAYALLLLGFVSILIFGPAYDDLKTNCLYNFLKDFQTAIAACIAVCAIWPVFGQLAEMRNQNRHTTLEYFRRRSVEIDREIDLLYKVMAGIEIVVRCFLDVGVSSQTPLGAAHVENTARLAKSRDDLSLHISRLIAERGPAWGGRDVQVARQNFLEEAQLFSVATRRLSSPTSNVAPMTDEFNTKLSMEIAAHRNGASRAAVLVHAALKADQLKIGLRISSLEASL